VLELGDQEVRAMPVVADSSLRNLIAIAVIAVSGMTLGCSSEAQPADLTAMQASAIISQNWSQNVLNHFPVVFHSDTIVECGVTNDLWKLTETLDRGYTRRSYQLTEKGSKVLFSIDLKESGKGHEITLRGPYHFEIIGVTPGTQPDTRNVELRWEVDWEKAPAELKACVPKFEMSGHLVALFRQSDRDWKFLSYLKPEDAPPATGAAPPPQ
jgi:hypothetical protein